jgi:1-deoxy-D-xylulose-5-phosphate reductoisomerase
MKHLSILGATGSIGRNTLAIAERFPSEFNIRALTAKTNVERLARQVERFRPEIVAVYDEKSAEALQREVGIKNVRIEYGPEGYTRCAALEGVDVVVAAMVGSAGLIPALAAIDAGNNIALANKETLVMAGEIVMDRANTQGVRILPVDSEHSAIFQCINGNRPRDLSRILLTGSGGPFRVLPIEEFSTITVEQALAHPNWAMGPKISIDSATMMNKGLEVIEAKHLFNVDLDQIEVLIHPQSVIHSMVAFQDGTVMAQMGIPDMKGAIAYALTCPERIALNMPLPDFCRMGSLDFSMPDFDRFPCLAHAFKACKIGGSAPAVLNAANEVAVDAFLKGDLAYAAISLVVESALKQHTPRHSPDLDDIISDDQWARRQARRFVKQHAQAHKRDQ